jgi:hypothetical protein
VTDFRHLQLVLDVARGLEEATDGLLRSAVILQDQVLEKRRDR